MTSRTLFTLLFASSVTVGCATDEGAPPATGAGGKADGETAQIVFGEDWSEMVSGSLVAGAPVRIAYDLDRLPECRGETGGSEVWGVTGFASFNGAAPVTFAVSRLDGGVVKPVAPELEIPANATSVALWFQVSNRWGCSAYDSNMNANYSFAITPGARGPGLAFESDWSESQSSVLAAGSQAVVHYAPERLAECAASSAGMAKWSITMHYKVDGGAEKTLLVTRADGAEAVASDPSFTVPRGQDLEVWFDATSVYGCHAYDSNLGGNYHYTVE